MANNLITIKHEFGKRGWVENHYEKAEIYPISDSQDEDSFSGYDNAKIKFKRKTSFNISIEEKNNNALATIKFHNNSNESYFFIKNHLPYNYLMLPSHSKIPVSPLFCGRTFGVTTADIRLFFFGNTCGYPGDLGRDEWQEIPSGKGFAFTTTLNDYIYFMPGKKSYNFESSNFYIVTEKWFTEKSINEELFSIFTSPTDICQTRENPRYIYNEDKICEPDYTPRALESFMQRFDFNGKNKDYSFEIRTNEVSAEIDGTHLNSLYDKL
ncbi:hypothetical protein OH773_18900 [Buttiauxella sp. WJP83]|uniref:hypothetical protein n=1 Tax=Buttiauxella sp. WJP83 TaxID=2986951 RepID=UPI0022DD4201|nr:hypothetical protein [Buttiauxella sp. WJP83]WBM70190.1 hypothetical protein OH773_18900 [Buttiauxella sp. WJP83]